MKKEIKSMQELIENYISSNENKIIISQKKDYRTLDIIGKDLYENIKKTISLLKKANIKQQDKIIIIGNNSIEWITIYFASILLGIIVVPLDITTDKILFEKIQKKVVAKAIFQDRYFQNFSKKIKTFYLDDLEVLIKNQKPINPETKIKPNYILEIMYTSGATGEPKGVVLTHENIISSLNSANSLIKLKLKLRVLNTLPLSHIFSQIYGLFILMYQNNHIYLIDTIQPRKIISFIKYKKINGMVTVPGILQSLKNELENKSTNFNFGLQFRIIGVGGASLDSELEKWWKDKLYLIIQGYGLTETSSVISANKIMASKLGSVGLIAKGVKVKFAKDQEILVQGKNIMREYYEDKQKTEESFQNGWFKTGDIGEIKKNYLYIKSRKKDLIVPASGLNIYPEDIENILDKIQGVKQSCVIEKNKKIHAVLILNKEIKPSEIIKKANEKLLSQQKIQDVSIWSEEDFPKTSLGKTKRFLVAEKIGAIYLKKFSYEEKLTNIINNILKPNKKILSNSKLVDLGMDSLKRIELITEIERQFGIEIDEIKLNQNTMVKDLEDFMKQEKMRKINFKIWPLNPLTKIVRYFGQKVFFNPLIRIFTKTEFIGLENLNKIQYSVIFVSNHQSACDVGILSKKLKNLAIAADPKVVFSMDVKGNFLYKFYKKFRGFFTTLFYNTYPFGELIGTNKSLEFTGELMDRKYSILFFPEGQRTRDGKIHDFKSGIGYLAINMKVPIIPIKIDGFFQVLPPGKIIPHFHKTIVKIGKPISPEIFQNISYIKATKLIEEKVKSL